MNELEKEVTGSAGDMAEMFWQMEERCWALEQEGDFTGFLAQFHESFVGWPYVAKLPMTKAKLRESVPKAFQRGKLLSYNIIPLAWETFGEVVVTHYLFTFCAEDLNGDEMNESTRITHTWMKQGGRWMIINAMTAN